MTYADRTKVAVTQSQSEITVMLRRSKASATIMFEEATRAAVGFHMRDRRILFHLPLNPKDTEQQRRTRWRGLLLCLKAKLEAVEAGIESFDDAFLAHIQLDTGETVGEHVRPTLIQHYKGGHMPPLIPPPKG